jgi:serine protease
MSQIMHHSIQRHTRKLAYKLLICAFFLLITVSCGGGGGDVESADSTQQDAAPEKSALAAQLSKLQLKSPQLQLTIKDDFPVQYSNGAFESRGKLVAQDALIEINNAIKKHSTLIATISKASKIPTQQLDEIRAKASELSGKPMPDMANDFVLSLNSSATPADVSEVITSLRKVKIITSIGLQDAAPVSKASDVSSDLKFTNYSAAQATIVNNITPRGFGVNTADLSKYQFYFKEAPFGTGTALVWGLPGGKGEGVTVTIIGEGIDKKHEDFPDITVYGEKCLAPPIQLGTAHDTSAMGIMAAQHNGFGINGAAPLAKFQYYSTQLGGFTGSTLADALTQLSSYDKPFSGDCGGQGFQRSDVVLFELEVPNFWLVPLDGRIELLRSLPFDVSQPVFKAITIVTALGTHVIIPAGNGYARNGVVPKGAIPGVNLNQLSQLYPNPYQDHNGIRVGATGTTILDGRNFNLYEKCYITLNTTEFTANSLSPAYFTNYGTGNYAVHLFASGYDVVTTGPYAGPVRSEENDCLPNGQSSGYSKEYNFFAGTSSASPIVAGAVAQIIGVYRARGQTISPKQLRDLLVNTGVKQVDDFERNIGSLPDVMAALSNSRIATRSPRVIAWPPAGSVKVPDKQIVYLPSFNPFTGQPSTGDGGGGGTNPPPTNPPPPPPPTNPPPPTTCGNTDNPCQYSEPAKPFYWGGAFPMGAGWIPISFSDKTEVHVPVNADDKTAKLKLQLILSSNPNECPVANFSGNYGGTSGQLNVRANSDSPTFAEAAKPAYQLLPYSNGSYWPNNVGNFYWAPLVACPYKWVWDGGTKWVTNWGSYYYRGALIQRAEPLYSEFEVPILKAGGEQRVEIELDGRKRTVVLDIKPSSSGMLTFAEISELSRSVNEWFLFFITGSHQEYAYRWYSNGTTDPKPVPREFINSQGNPAYTGRKISIYKTVMSHMVDAVVPLFRCGENLSLVYTSSACERLGFIYKATAISRYLDLHLDSFSRVPYSNTRMVILPAANVVASTRGLFGELQVVPYDSPDFKNNVPNDLYVLFGGGLGDRVEIDVSAPSPPVIPPGSVTDVTPPTVLINPLSIPILIPELQSQGQCLYPDGTQPACTTAQFIQDRKRKYDRDVAAIMTVLDDDDEDDPPVASLAAQKAASVSPFATQKTAAVQSAPSVVERMTNFVEGMLQNFKGLIAQ